MGLMIYPHASTYLKAQVDELFILFSFRSNSNDMNFLGTSLWVIFGHPSYGPPWTIPKTIASFASLTTSLLS
jgi:hypothetical protein